MSDTVTNKDNIQYDVYPGDFSSQAKKNIQKNLCETRIQLWKDTETDEPKDEVLDKRLTQMSDALKRIKALLLGKKGLGRMLLTSTPSSTGKSIT